MRSIFTLITIFAGIIFAQAADRPNVLLILADDMGYSDLGCYGSEIETPNIDRLASEGLQFSHFRATPMCVTSRIALMSGMPMHRAGSHHYGHSIPLAQLLKTAGYRTMMTGKWHGGSPDPRDAELFDRSLGFLGGATDSFVGGDDWFLDDKPFTEFSDGFYSTHAFANRSIDFMKEAIAKRQPFFMYVAFNAPHHPCQAPKPTVDKYRQTYERGYAAIRQQRRQRQIELGLVNRDWPVAPIENEVRRWSELTEHRKEVEGGRMAAYAAAVDEVDQSVGRMLAFLADSGIEQNTLVIFLSDNGGDYSNGSITTDEQQIPWMPRTNPSSSNGWAAVKCTPFRYYKHSCHEGGIATPMVIRWPAGTKQPPGEIIDAPASITDIYPTLIELAGIQYPTKFRGRDVRTPTGASLLPLLESNGNREGTPIFEWYQFSRAWVEDDWKAVSLYGGPWQLFNLREDRCESNDLSVEYPDLLAGLVGKWQDFAFESGVPEAGEPVIDVQHGWGWHRLCRAFPTLTALTPANGATTNSTTIELRMTFAQPIDFANTSNKNIYLYDVSDESKPVWQSDPDETHAAQGKLTVSFADIPPLLANRHYAIRCDAGWIKIGGRPGGALNDGAYWWRFRTPSD